MSTFQLAPQDNSKVITVDRSSSQLGVLPLCRQIPLAREGGRLSRGCVVSSFPFTFADRTADYVIKNFFTAHQHQRDDANVSRLIYTLSRVVDVNNFSRQLRIYNFQSFRTGLVYLCTAQLRGHVTSKLTRTSICTHCTARLIKFEIRYAV